MKKILKKLIINHHEKKIKNTLTGLKKQGLINSFGVYATNDSINNKKCFLVKVWLDNKTFEYFSNNHADLTNRLIKDFCLTAKCVKDK